MTTEEAFKELIKIWVELEEKEKQIGHEIKELRDKFKKDTEALLAKITE